MVGVLSAAATVFCLENPKSCVGSCPTFYVTGGRVFATANGELWRAIDVRPPTGCTAEEGSCRRSLIALDGEQRFNRTDGVDLASRETLLVDFEKRRPGVKLGLVVGARQTLLITFLFYQALAFMGRNATRYLVRLEGGDDSLRRKIGGIHDVLFGIEVQVKSVDNTWTTVGQYDETGPVATDVQLVRCLMEQRSTRFDCCSPDASGASTTLRW